MTFGNTYDFWKLNTKKPQSVDDPFKETVSSDESKHASLVAQKI
jgi:hypothetical protein